MWSRWNWMRLSWWPEGNWWCRSIWVQKWLQKYYGFMASEILLEKKGLINGSESSQLYDSTTVVMATNGLHWKWQSLTPCQRHPIEPIEKIFGTIDYVIDLNNLAKFGFGKIFPDEDTHTQHINNSTLCHSLPLFQNHRHWQFQIWHSFFSSLHKSSF